MTGEAFLPNDILEHGQVGLLGSRLNGRSLRLRKNTNHKDRK